MKFAFVFALCMVLLAATVSSELFYQVDVLYSNDSYSITSIDVIYSRFNETNFQGDDFVIRLMEEDMIFYSENFKFAGYDFVENYSGSDSEAEFEFLNEYSASVYVPYDSRATDLIIEDSSGSVILSSDVSKKGALSVSPSRPDLPLADEESANDGTNYLIFFIFALLVFAFVVLYYFLHGRKRGNVMVLRKKAQQASFGMSFNMLFSIFLIIVFIAVAIIVIKVFLDSGCQMETGSFYVELQEEVSDAWRSSQTSKSLKFDICGDVTHICFANLSAPVTGDDVQFEMIQDYMYYDVNTFLIPPGSANGLQIKQIDHLDVSRITASSNPYCVSNPGKLTISKGIRSKLVSIS